MRKRWRNDGTAFRGSGAHRVPPAQFATGHVFVYGIESDIQWSHIQQASTVNAPCCEPTVTSAVGTDQWSANANLDWFGTTRARFGILASPRLLFYATGGAIYGGQR